MAHRIRSPFILLFALIGLAASCSKPKTAGIVNSPSPSQSTAPSASTSGTPGADNFACTLLTKEEAQAVQGEAFQTTKPSQRSSGGEIISQCYFELPTPVNSIVLTVMRKGESGRDPSESWKDMFHPDESARKKEEEGEKEGKEPQKVDGIGDEAFWTGTRVGGALYVLKGNCYIRISVGGAGDQAQKTEKSKALAAYVLKRL